MCVAAPAREPGKRRGRAQIAMSWRSKSENSGTSVAAVSRSSSLYAALREMVWGRDHGALTLANGRRRGLESHQLYCEADIVACHPRMSVLDRALKLHVSLG